jgi:hypothetical protein
MAQALLAVLFAASVAGCGSADPPAAIEAHPAQFAHALCAKLFSCCPPPGTPFALARWTGDPPDEAFCEDAVAQALTSRLGYLKESVAGGRVSYSESATQDCLSELGRTSCEDFRWSATFPTGGCWVLTGRVQTGGGCAENYECARGRCNVNSARIGSCMALPAAGERCAATGVCQTGAMCLGGMCVQDPAKGAGAACGDSIECRSRLCGPTGSDPSPTCAPVQACGFFP